MVAVVLIGGNAALMGGVVESLGAAGFETVLADSVDAGAQIAAANRPLALLVERETAIGDPRVMDLPLRPGGALILFRTADDRAEAFPAGLARAALAELTLPLERNRLVALLQVLRDRVHSRGHGEVGGRERPAH